MDAAETVPPESSVARCVLPAELLTKIFSYSWSQPPDASESEIQAWYLSKEKSKELETGLKLMQDEPYYSIIPYSGFYKYATVKQVEKLCPAPYDDESFRGSKIEWTPERYERLCERRKQMLSEFESSFFVDMGRDWYGTPRLSDSVKDPASYASRMHHTKGFFNSAKELKGSCTHRTKTIRTGYPPSDPSRIVELSPDNPLAPFFTRESHVELLTEYMDSCPPGITWIAGTTGYFWVKNRALEAPKISPSLSQIKIRACNLSEILNLESIQPGVTSTLLPPITFIPLSNVKYLMGFTGALGSKLRNKTSKGGTNPPLTSGTSVNAAPFIEVLLQHDWENTDNFLDLDDPRRAHLPADVAVRETDENKWREKQLAAAETVLERELKSTRWQGKVHLRESASTATKSQE